MTGDFVVPPGYTAVRPEHQPSILPEPVRPASQPLRTGPSTDAFAFRETEPESGEVDVEGIRSFLTSGQMIDGGSDSFVGQPYPGSLTGVHASQVRPRHDYSFGPVKSDVLADADTEKELRVDGNTLTSGDDGPIVVLSRGSDEDPNEAKMTKRYVRTLRRIGVPVEREEVTTEALRERVYRHEDFHIAPLDAQSVSEFAVESLYERFHSDNADDHASAEVGKEKNTDAFLTNPTGYGLTEFATADETIEEARDEMAAEARNDLARRATEHIYLDFPVMVVSYEKRYWPADRQRFEGFVGDIPVPGDTYLPTQLLQLRRSSGS